MWGKPEETQMGGIFGGVMGACAPGERPMVNPHTPLLSRALPQVTAAAGFSDVQIRCAWQPANAPCWLCLV